ncbi:hypothetical protein [Gottfriedia acidiceleris]|uniref:hypothetical protein n=1 Tax=Gottfriedia acidiceleris TaxID=371036 RepID=UPI0030003F53
MTRKKYLFIPIICCILYLGLHAAPSLAIRTKLFFHFHPKAALTSKVYLFEKNGKRYQPYPEYTTKHHAKVYLINHPPRHRAPNGEMVVWNDYIVYQKGPIFFAKNLYDEIAKIMNV